MSQLINENGWVWVFVQDPGKNEQIVGQQYEEDNISFIPAFTEKDEAMKCYNMMNFDPATKYEAQAIHIDELKVEAAGNGFVIFILDGQGKILEKMLPSE